MNELIISLEKEKNELNFKKYEIEAAYSRNMADKVYNFFNHGVELNLDMKSSYQTLVEICQMPPMSFIEDPEKYECLLENKSLLFIIVGTMHRLSKEDIQKLNKIKIYNFPIIINSLNIEREFKKKLLEILPLFHEILKDLVTFYLSLNEEQEKIFVKYAALNCSAIPGKEWYSENASDIQKVYEENAKLKERKLRQKRKEILSKQKAYESVINKLEQIPTSNYIYLTENEIESLSANSLESVFKYIVKNNQEVYCHSTKQVDILNGKAENRLNEIFMTHHIPLLKEKENISRVLRQEESEIQDRLLWLKDHFKQLEEKALVELLICPREIYDRLILFSQYFTYEFMQQNFIRLLQPDIQTLILKNTEILAEYQINCKGLNEILLSKELQKNINLAQHYKLDISDKNVLLSITDKVFFDAYDIWIENGIEMYWSQNYPVIKDDIQNITKRILISLTMQLQPFDSQGNLQDFVLNAKKFYVSDNELDNYLPHTNLNFIEVENKMLLDQSSRKNIKEDIDLPLPQSENSLCYSLGNVLISKPKVLRNLQVLEDKSSILDAVLYGSLLSVNQCLEIVDQLSNSSKLTRHME